MAELFSVRMRASRGGTHTSGAERIVPDDEIETAAASLISRAMTHENGAPEEIKITVESLAGKEILRLRPLRVIIPQAPALHVSHEIAISELVKAGVSEEAAKIALEAIISGASPAGGNMRGAMLVDATTGERLEPDGERGIRARAVDWAKEAETHISPAENELACTTPHFREALALATKAANAPEAVAELCISDDPHYTTGYVASRAFGYCRIASMKETGCRFGGRAFFVHKKNLDIDEYIGYMRKTPVLVNGNVEVLHADNK